MEIFEIGASARWTPQEYGVLRRYCIVQLLHGLSSCWLAVHVPILYVMVAAANKKAQLRRL
jgi:hypothetical protein